MMIFSGDERIVLCTPSSIVSGISGTRDCRPRRPLDYALAHVANRNLVADADRWCLLMSLLR